MEVKFGKLNIKLSDLQCGSKVDNNNEFLKKYDKDGDSIFSYSELYDLKKDIEKAAGDDKNLQEEEAIKLFAQKLNIPLDEAKKQFQKLGNLVNSGIENLSIQKEANDITEVLHELIEDNFTYRSLHKSDFANSFNKINDKNIIYVLDSYKKKSGGESLISAIFNEISCDSEKQVELVKKLYSTLFGMIDKTKYNTSEIQKVFNEAIKDGSDSQNQKKLDLVFDTMIEMIKGKYTNEKASTKETIEASNGRNSEAKSAVDSKSQTQGKVSQALDYIAGLAGGLTEEEIRKIVNEHEKEIAELEKLKNNPKAFAAKFKEIFGVEYNPKSVANYNKINATYEKARDTYIKELQMNEKFKDIFKIDYNSYCDVTRRYPSQGKMIIDTIYMSMCNLLGKDLVDTYLKENQYQDKYLALKQLADDMKNMAHRKTLSKCDGQTFEELAKSRESAYHIAYGFSKDSYLKAQDWISAQNQRLANTQIGVTAIALTGALFTGGGSLALLSSAVLLTNPVSFVEQATDPDGMTKEDWNNFFNNTAETLGWMALGLGAAKVGKLVANATKAVKLKGLTHLMKQGGKSLDDLLKNSDKLDPAIVSQIKQAQTLSQTLGITTEAAVDITTTALLQKEGATTGDWIMSIAGAILGSSKVQATLKSAGNNATSKLKQMFPDLNISDTDAKKILEKAGIKIREVNTKLNNWSKTETKRAGLAYSSIVPISPVMLEKTAKLVTRLVTDGVEMLFSAVSTKKTLGNFKAQDEKMYNAITDVMTDITTKICAGDIPSKSMLSDEALKPIAEKYGVDIEDLRENVKFLMEDDPNWEVLSGCFEMSPAAAKAEKELLLDCIDNLKKNLGLEEKAVTKGTEIVNNKAPNGIEDLFTSDIAKSRFKTLVKTPTLYNAVEEAFIEICSKICDGEIPCKEMFSPDALSSIAGKHGVDKNRLSTQVLEILQKDDNWKTTIATLSNKSKNSLARNTAEVDALVAKFRNKLGLYSKEHENAIEKLYSSLKDAIAKGEIPSEDLLLKTANTIAEEFGVSSDELINSIKQRMGEKDSGWKSIASYFDKPQDKINKASLEENINKFKTEQGMEVVAKETDATSKADAENNVQKEVPSSTPKKEKFKVTDELYAKYEKDVYETAFFDSESRAKAVEIMEAYEKHIAGKNIDYSNFDSRDIYEFINKYDVNSNDVDRIEKLIKERFHKNVIQEEVRINSLKQTYGVSEEVIQKTDNIISKIEVKMNNGDKITKSEIDELISENITDQRVISKVENLIYENPKIKDYVETCTHRSLYTKYKDFDEKSINDAIKTYDEIMNRINSGEKITKDDLYNYFGKLDVDADKVLEDLIMKHDDLSAIYKEMY